MDHLRSLVLLQLRDPFFLQASSHCYFLLSSLQDANCHFVFLFLKMLCHRRVLSVLHRMCPFIRSRSRQPVSPMYTALQAVQVMTQAYTTLTERQENVPCGLRRGAMPACLINKMMGQPKRSVVFFLLFLTLSDFLWTVGSLKWGNLIICLLGFQQNIPIPNCFFANFVWLEHIGFWSDLLQTFRKDSWRRCTRVKVIRVEVSQNVVHARTTGWMTCTR